MYLRNAMRQWHLFLKEQIFHKALFSLINTGTETERNRSSSMEPTTLADRRKKMLNVYLSGPITGTEDYKDRFEFGEAKVHQKFKDKARAINPVKIGEQLPEKISYDEIMQICFDTIRACDVVLLMPGWEDSKGCNQEYGYAIGIGKEVVRWEEWF